MELVTLKASDMRKSEIDDVEFTKMMQELKTYLESDNEKVREFWRIYYDNVTRVAKENNIELDCEQARVEFGNEGQANQQGGQSGTPIEEAKSPIKKLNIFQRILNYVRLKKV